MSRTLSPLRFMKVCGFARRTLFPSIMPSPVSALCLRRFTFIPYLSASRSTAINPALCLVFSYFLPGFPRPTMTVRFPGSAPPAGSFLLSKERTDGNISVDPFYCLGKQRSYRQGRDLVRRLVFGKRDRIEHYQFLYRRTFHPFECRSGKHSMCTAREHLFGAHFHQRLRCVHNSTCRIDKVVYEDDPLVPDIADDVHHFAYICLRSSLVDNGDGDV